MLNLAATCLFGLEKLLGEEIDRLGLHRTETIDGRVYFEGTALDIARANIGLRCAEHIFVVLGRYPATTFEELFDGANALPWEEWIGRDDAFPVKGHSIKSGLTSLPDCQRILKKAIVNRLSAKYGLSWFPETGVKYQIEFFLFKDTADLMIDTSGVPLHKRGYRTDSGLAPMRETLAAALALTARPREDVLFWDPMCGSGTIAIEAAQILQNRAPGLDRAFAAESFPQIPPEIWRRAREEATAAIRTDARFTVRCSDIDPKVLKVAAENAKRAHIADFCEIFCADVRNLRKPDGVRGTIVCNPPYGERLMSPDEVDRLYREMGRAFADLAPWQYYIITSHPQFERLFGQRADKVRKLYNGMIPCNLYQFFRPKDDKGTPRKK